MIKKTSKGYVVESESKNSKGEHKKLSKPESKSAAKRRLEQVEYFKSKGK